MVVTVHRSTTACLMSLFVRFLRKLARRLPPPKTEVRFANLHESLVSSRVGNEMAHRMVQRQADSASLGAIQLPSGIRGGVKRWWESLRGSLVLLAVVPRGNWCSRAVRRCGGMAWRCGRSYARALGHSQHISAHIVVSARCKVGRRGRCGGRVCLNLEGCPFRLGGLGGGDAAARR